MSSYKDFIDAGAKMDFNPYKTNVATSQCALNYTGSSFAGGKSLKKTTTTNKAPVKKTTVKKTKVSKKK
tara:strand:- start:1797 stop:2003 length:207 start_codon:yes stop_codon:yes gene_type:complete